jgi:hypothetical protein
MRTPRMKKKPQFARVHVVKEFQSGSGFEPVGAFYTHYRARKFVLEQISQQSQPQDFRWVIRTVQPS